MINPIILCKHKSRSRLRNCAQVHKANIKIKEQLDIDGGYLRT